MPTPRRPHPSAHRLAFGLARGDAPRSRNGTSCLRNSLAAAVLVGCTLGSGLATAQPAQPAAAGSAGAATTEIAGVRLPGQVTVADSTLQLNGAGLRTRFVVRVYVAGLYLSGRADSPEAVFAAPGPKRLHVVMLRDVDANELGRLFTRGMQDNTAPQTFSRVVPGTLRIGEIFAEHKRLKAGDHFSVDWLPGRGTQVLVNGVPQGEPITEPEFFNSMLGIWLGPKPADASLKNALLGKTPAPAAGGS